MKADRDEAPMELRVRLRQTGWLRCAQSSEHRGTEHLARVHDLAWVAARFPCLAVIR